MKIFFDYNIFYRQKFGGISSYYYNLFEEFNRRKISFLACPIFNKNRYITKIKKNIFSINIFQCPSIFYNFLDKLNYEISKSFLKFYSPDIIHITYYNKNILEYKKAKKILTVYDMVTEIFPSKENLKISKVKEQSIKSSDHIIAISKKTKEDLISYFNVPSKKISVIYLGTNLMNKFNNINKKENFILYVGSRKSYKNFEKFLYAIRSSSLLYDDFNIICFGGENFSKYDKDILNKYQFELSKIKFIFGKDEVLKKLYSTAKLFVYPSLYEGFGLPILEAMANNCPVLCSNRGSLPEIAGDAAIYFNPDSVEDIKSSIENVIYNETCLRFLIKKGISRVKLFSWSNCANKTYKLYQNTT